MTYLILGTAALALALLAMRSFAHANTAKVARRMQVGTGVASLLLAGVLFLRGLSVVAFPLAMFGSWLLWGTPTPWGGGRGRKTPGQTSRIETAHLEMELE